ALLVQHRLWRLAVKGEIDNLAVADLEGVFVNLRAGRAVARGVSLVDCDLQVVIGRPVALPSVLGGFQLFRRGRFARVIRPVNAHRQQAEDREHHENDDPVAVFHELSCSYFFSNECDLGTTTIPSSVTVRPRARSASALNPISMFSGIVTS